MDLVRKILIAMHDDVHGYQTRQLEIEGYSSEAIGYHCYLLDQAGLIEAIDVSKEAHGSPHALPMNLTWAGHEFIENAYHETVWRQAREVVGKLGEVSFSIWSQVLTVIVMKQLGIGN
ncbi:DUF2513 domain-containing protein [Gilvimarinus sp. F26214L]